jgi:hypothetical protein
MCWGSGPATAAITGVAGGLSFGTGSAGGTPASIIAAPPDVLNSAVTNTGMQGFNEAQGVTTTVAHGVDGGGTIAVGTRVDGHMIFLNSEGDARLGHLNTVWTFDGIILRVISGDDGLLESASSFERGAPGTNFATGPGAAPFPFRGLESFSGTGAGDGYQIPGGGTQLRVSMLVSNPGDWIRVITSPSPVPVPGAAWLFASALGALGYLGRQRRATA